MKAVDFIMWLAFKHPDIYKKYYKAYLDETEKKKECKEQR